MTITIGAECEGLSKEQAERIAAKAERILRLLIEQALEEKEPAQ